MYQKYQIRASNIFLLEFGFSILIFLFGCSVCVPFFVQAHLLSEKARVLDHAVIESCNLSEIIRVSDSKEQAIDLIRMGYPDNDLTDDTVSIYYDKDFRICNLEYAVYVLRVSLYERDGLLVSHVFVDKLDDPDDHIYKLILKQCLLD